MTGSAIDVRPHFAEFGVRMAAISLDLFLLLLLVTNVLLPAVPAIEGTPLDSLPGAVVLFSLYFAAFWVSPLKATPVQFLFGMRVVDLKAEKLTPGRAAVRAVALIVLVAATFMFFREPGNPLRLVGIVGFLLLFPAIVTTNRQAAHDFLARSIVVNRTALNAESRKAELLEHLVDPESATRPQRRPSIPRIVVDALVLAIPVIAIWNGVLVAHDMNLRARVGYAIKQTSALKTGVAIHRDLYDEWPSVDTDLGMPSRGRYRDGGYYELEEDGVIRIHFEVKRELKSGTIVLEPEWRDGDTVWGCRTEGSIAPGRLPAACRD